MGFRRFLLLQIVDKLSAVCTGIAVAVFYLLSAIAAIASVWAAIVYTVFGGLFALLLALVRDKWSWKAPAFFYGNFDDFDSIDNIRTTIVDSLWRRRRTLVVRLSQQR